MRKILLSIVILCALPLLGQSINPTTNITWPRITVTSGVPAQACTTANYGQPYQVTGVTPNQWGSCGTDGWALRGTSSGVTASYNPASGNLIAFVSGSAVSIGPPFSATFGCSQCGVWEIGYSISSASGTISYVNPSVPTSASVSDGTNTDTLTTPFTSWSLAHTYNTNTTFTLTALGNGQTITQTQNFVLTNCTFSGVGIGGTATGATASGAGTGDQCVFETSTLSGATATLSSNPLGNTYTNQSFSLNPSGQYMYLLLTGGCGHTLTVNSFTTAFNTTAISSYTNILGGTQANMCIYSSPTSYTGPYTVQVTS
jgi:hypothetical protein